MKWHWKSLTLRHTVARVDGARKITTRTRAQSTYKFVYCPLCCNNQQTHVTRTTRRGREMNRTRVVVERNGLFMFDLESFKSELKGRRRGASTVSSSIAGKSNNKWKESQTDKLVSILSAASWKSCWLWCWGGWVRTSIWFGHSEMYCWVYRNNILEIGYILLLFGIGNKHKYLFCIFIVGRVEKNRNTRMVDWREKEEKERRRRWQQWVIEINYIIIIGKFLFFLFTDNNYHKLTLNDLVICGKKPPSFPLFVL